jgi:hypothetical protein
MMRYKKQNIPNKHLDIEEVQANEIKRLELVNKKLCEFVKSQKPLPPEIAKVINDNFDKLLSNDE